MRVKYNKNLHVKTHMLYIILFEYIKMHVICKKNNIKTYIFYVKTFLLVKTHILSVKIFLYVKYIHVVCKIFCNI